MAALEPAGFGTLPITAVDAELAGRLPQHHRDPFDRMLVAQAARLDAVVVSKDEAFKLYEIDVLAA